MPGGSQRLYLAESVAAAVEVKSDISAQWSQLEHSVQLLRPVRRRWQGSTRLMGSGIAFGLPSESPVPFIAVGFTGYGSIETLKKKLDSTPPDRRPDAVVVIQSGAFVGLGCQAYGALGLYGLAVVLTNLLRAVSSAGTDIGAYVAAHVE